MALCLATTLTPLPAQAQTTPDSPHLAQHRNSIRSFDALRKTNPAAALKQAQRDVAAANRLPLGDPRRADAAELLALAYMATEDWQRALPAIIETVRLRRNARPPEPELLALALGAQGVVLFGLDRAAEADAVLSEHLAIWRQVFGANDLRLADKLEQNAEQVQKGFGRRAWVMELLREAVAIRRQHPPNGRFAATLQDLATYEMLEQALSAADEHLALAGQVLTAEMHRLPNDEQLRAGLAQVLVSRSGMAANLGRQTEAQQWMEQAQKLRFKDRVLAAETAVLIAQARGEQLRRAGLYQAAIKAHSEALTVLERNQDLINRGALDDRLFADVFMALGQLHIETGDLGLAKELLQSAQKGLGDTPELLLLQAELAQRSGDAAASLKLYQAAMKQRKQSATEATVLFGTTRRPATGTSASEARFGGDDANRLTLGQVDVLVPGGALAVHRCCERDLTVRYLRA